MTRKSRRRVLSSHDWLWKHNMCIKYIWLTLVLEYRIFIPHPVLYIVYNLTWFSCARCVIRIHSNTESILNIAFEFVAWKQKSPGFERSSYAWNLLLLRAAPITINVYNKNKKSCKIMHFVCSSVVRAFWKHWPRKMRFSQVRTDLQSIYT